MSDYIDIVVDDTPDFIEVVVENIIDRGLQGIPGNDGADGSDGLSAYQIAVNEGFVGNEAAWLLSLEGPQGVQGIQGEQGEQGEPGADATGGVLSVTGPTVDNSDSSNPVVNTPNLQQVTNISGITTNNIVVSGANSFVAVSNGSGHTAAVKVDSVENTGFLQLGAVAGLEAYVFPRLLTETRNYELPDASGTLALLSDIPEGSQNLQSVTTGAGNNTTDQGIEIIENNITVHAGSFVGDQANIDLQNSANNKFTYIEPGMIDIGNGVGDMAIKADNLTNDHTGQLQDSNGTFAWLSDVENEASAREAADTNLQNEIEGVDTDLAQEVTDRIAADTQLSTDIAVAQQNAENYADSLVLSSVKFAGFHDASTGLFPAAGTGTGTSGAVRRGDEYEISVAGTIAGVAYDIGDTVRAKINTPGQTAANWGSSEHNTQQATESIRGTGMLSTIATIQDELTANDTDITTPYKFWKGIARLLQLPLTWAAKQIFSVAPRFVSVTANHYLKVDGSKELTSSLTIPVADIAGLGSLATQSGTFSDKANQSSLDTTNANVATNTSNISANTSAIATKQGIITLTTSAATPSLVSNTLNVPALQNPFNPIEAALGSNALFYTFGKSRVDITTTIVMVSSRCDYVLLPVPYTTSIAGVKFWLTTKGVYTANQTNEINLYSYSGGILTKVAGSGNIGTIWSAGTVNTWVPQAFTTSVTVNFGTVYYIGLIWNSSATTTTPQIGGYPTLQASQLGGDSFSNSAKTVGARIGQAALAATTEAMSNLSLAIVQHALAVY